MVHAVDCSLGLAPVSHAHTSLTAAAGATAAGATAGVSCMALGRVLACGGTDGKIRLLDPGLRSAGTTRTFDGYSGAVASVALKVGPNSLTNLLAN